MEATVQGQKTFPTMETRRLVLRQLATEDAAALLNYCADPEVNRYLTLDPFQTQAEAVAMIELLKNLFANKQGIRWAITGKDSGKFLGTCGFHNYKPEHRRIEMGYELDRPFWRQGFMSEALPAILEYAFAQMNSNRVEAFVNAGNVKSTGILEKMGFKLDGVLREYEFARGKFVDQYCYSLLKSDY